MSAWRSSRSRMAAIIANVAVTTPATTQHARRVVFLDGPNGRSRVALASAAVLLEALRTSERPPTA